MPIPFTPPWATGTLITKNSRGVHVMTIHKSKGEEFHEVFVYEGTHYGRTLRPHATVAQTAEARFSLRGRESEDSRQLRDAQQSIPSVSMIF